MSHFLHLPCELLSQITSFLHPVYDRQTLRNLCLASSTLNTLAQPILFTIHSDTCLLHNYSTVADYHLAVTESLVQFGRTIILRPDLALRVKSLQVDIDCGELTEEARVPGRHPSQQDAEILIRGIKRLRSKFESEWITGIQNFRMNEILALIVSQSVNLEVLSFAPVEGLAPLLELAENACKPLNPPHLRPLVRLKHLHLTESLGHELPNIVPLLPLPYLETFTAIRCVGKKHTSGNERQHAAKLQPASCNISTLILRSSVLDVESLNMLLAACKHLKVFDYSPWGDYVQVVDDMRHFTETELFSALQRHGTHLEELRLDFQSLGHVDLPPSRECAGFPSLKRITLDQSSIGEPGFLPSSLEHLCITEGDSLFYMILNSIVDAKQTHLHLLRQVKVIPGELSSISEIVGFPKAFTDRKSVLREVANWRRMLRANEMELLIELHGQDVVLYGDL